MKKLLLLIFSSFILLMMTTGCGNNDSAVEDQESADTPAESEANMEETAADEHEHAHADGEPIEPNEEHLCEFCNMVVYGRDDEMGVFTAQALTESGENIFFDDIGCLLNYDRVGDEKLITKWIRDHESLDWIIQEDGIPVKTDLESPMKYGYVFFENEEKANKFVEENPDINPAIADWSSIDAVAKERYEKKMKAQGESNGHDHDHDNMHEEDHSH